MQFLAYFYAKVISYWAFFRVLLAHYTTTTYADDTTHASKIILLQIQRLGSWKKSDKSILKKKKSLEYIYKLGNNVSTLNSTINRYYHMLCSLGKFTFSVFDIKWWNNGRCYLVMMPSLVLCNMSHRSKVLEYLDKQVLF